MQKTKSLLLLSLVIITFITTTILYAIPTLAKKEKEGKNVEFVLIDVYVDEKGKTWVTIGIYVNGRLVTTVTFDPPRWGPGLPGE
ncbi:MAG: hypothetical protein N3E39_01115 [Candidatus Methanomethylicia archaeon]|nr:hypothetical protein [Candidatus Methanomethylicia archaeon]